MCVWGRSSQREIGGNLKSAMATERDAVYLVAQWCERTQIIAPAPHDLPFLCQ